MSMRITVRGVDLVLFAGEDLEIEHVNNALLDGFEDDHALTFDAPIAGNETVLGHVHRLDLNARVLELDDAVLWHAGLPLHQGNLQVLGSAMKQQYDGTEIGVYRLSFVVQGFISQVKGTKVRDLDLGEPILVENIVDHAEARNAEAWPEASHCFPMHYNPELYGDANPNWFPEAPDWDTVTAYAVNDQVTEWSGDPLIRPMRYQCTAANAGRPPAANPSYWRKTAYGIVNHWDHAHNTFFVNDGVAEYYTMVPFFYLKYYVQKVLANYGLRPTGEWWEDTRYDRRAVLSNQTLDSDSQTNYFRATQTGAAVTVTGTDPEAHILPCNDDTTTPNSDVDGVWNDSNFRWTCPAAGTFKFRVWLSHTGGSGIKLRVALMRDESTDVQQREITTGHNHDRPIYVVMYVVIPSAYIGSQFYLSAFRTDGAPLTIDRTWIEGWKVEDNPYPPYDRTIDPVEHAPSMDVDEFFLDLKDAYGLDIQVDRLQGTMTLNYADGKFARTSRDETSRMQERVELDHGTRTVGMGFKWDVDTGVSRDLTQMLSNGEEDTVFDLDPAPGPSTYVVIKNSRMLLWSTLVAGVGYRWEIAGHLLDEVLVGEEDGARVITPQLQPMLMAIVDSGGEEFLVPWISEKGNSRFYPTGQNAASLRVVDFHGMQPNKNGIDFPFASCWGRSPQDGTRLREVDMNWSDEFSQYPLHWERLASALVNADPVRADMLVDHAFVKGSTWRDRIMIGNQLYLITRMPVSYGSDEQLRAEQVELLRLNPKPE